MFNNNSSDSEMRLPRRTWITRPLSCIILNIIRLLESNRQYFETPIEASDSDEEKIRKVGMYFHYAFYDRSRWYLTSFIGFIGIVGLDAFGYISTGISLQALGLFLDGIGALIIARGLFRGPEGILVDTPSLAGTTYGSSERQLPAPLSSTVRSTVDGIYGSFFLAVGFGIQILAITSTV